MRQQTIDNLPTSIKLDGSYEEREIYLNGKYLNPTLSKKMRNHSPDGFNWGYGGSGPAQLSLAILMHFMSVEDALYYYQDFKWKVIAGLPQGDFEIEINLRQEIQTIASKRINA